MMNKEVSCLALALALTFLAGPARPYDLGNSPQPTDAVRTVGYEDMDMQGDKFGKDEHGAKACYPPRWAHKTGLFGEYMLLRSNEGEVAYGVLADNVANFLTTGENLAQRSHVFTVDPGSSSNFRVGGSLALSECSSIQLTYANFYGRGSDAQSFDPADVRAARIVPLSLHPFPQDAAQLPLDASAESIIDFETVDIDYRSMLWGNELGALNYLVGARYANLNQQYASAYGGTGNPATAQSDVRFDGGGIRFGLDGERHHACSGLLLYGRGLVSMVAGQFRTSYESSDVVGNFVDTGWKADRIMTTLDLELGGGWQSQCGHLRVTCGYMISSWFNAVTTDQWIRAVGRGNFVGQPDSMSYDTLMFDGLTVRAEWRF
jgi:hypothetical protein